MNFSFTLAIINFRGMDDFSKFLVDFSIVSFLVSFIQGNQQNRLNFIRSNKTILASVEYYFYFIKLFFFISIVVVLSAILTEQSVLSITFFALSFGLIKSISFFTRLRNIILGSCDILIIYLTALISLKLFPDLSAFECLTFSALFSFLVQIAYNTSSVMNLASIVSRKKNLNYKRLLSTNTWRPQIILGVNALLGNSTRLLDLWILSILGFGEIASGLRIIKQFAEIPNIIKGLPSSLIISTSFYKQNHNSSSFKLFLKECSPINLIAAFVSACLIFFLLSDLFETLYGINLQGSKLLILSFVFYTYLQVYGPVRLFYSINGREMVILKVQIIATVFYFVSLIVLAVFLKIHNLELFVSNKIWFDSLVISALILLIPYPKKK